MARIRSIKPEEAAEFRGSFFGEGHIDMMKNGRAKTLTPRVRISVRDDDAATLHWCRDLWGWSIHGVAKTRSVCWTLTGRDTLTPLAACLSGGTMPSKKRPEVVLLLEAIGLIGSRWYPSDQAAKDRQREIRDALKGIRAYKDVA